MGAFDFSDTALAAISHLLEAAVVPWSAVVRSEVRGDVLVGLGLEGGSGVSTRRSVVLISVTIQLCSC